MVSETKPVLNFPSYVRRWPHPGIASSMRTREDSERLNNLANEHFQKYMQRGWTQEKAGRQAYAEVFSKTFTYSEEGMSANEPFALDGITYEEACDFVEKEVLRKPLDGMTPGIIDKTIQAIHKRILDPSHGNLKGHSLGEYRNSGEMLVYKQPDKVNDDVTLLSFLNSKKNSAKGVAQKTEIERQIQHVNEFLTAQQNGNMGYDIINKKLVSADAIKIFQEYYKCFPSGKDVASLMKGFYEKLSQKLSDKKEDAISIACWAHLEFVRIHPFVEGNGRMARMLMNIILMQGGHQPIAFAFDSIYTAALRKEDAGDVGAFERLIRRLVRQFDYEAMPIRESYKYVLVTGAEVSDEEKKDKNIPKSKS